MGTRFVLDESDSTFQTAGTLAIGTSGSPATGHAVTLEQVIVLLRAFSVALSTQIPAVITGAGLLAQFDVIMNMALPAAGALPIAPYLAALQGALAIPQDPTGTLPGVGRPGLRF
jgi:hypothetical protein